MKTLRSLLAAGLLGLASAVSAEPLGEKMKSAGYEWILGDWGDKATNGEAVRLSYELRLDGHAVAVRLRTPDMEAEGLIAQNPKNDDIGYLSVDNRGGGAMGKVSIEDGSIVIKVGYVGGDGDEGRMGIVHEKKDADSLRLVIRRVGEGGELGEVKRELELVRLKK